MSLCQLLNFLCFVKYSDKVNLSKQIFIEQVKNNWPGPVKEVDEICEELSLPKLSSHDIYKNEIEEACKKKAEKNIKEEMEKSSKMKCKTEEVWERQEYLENKKVHEARAMFSRLQNELP